MARKMDNSAIGSLQNLGFEELLLFAHKQLSLGQKVYAAYEAGPLGYVLNRRLRELGIEAYVSAPECLDQGKRKFNKLDARPSSPQNPLNSVSFGFDFFKGKE